MVLIVEVVFFLKSLNLYVGFFRRVLVLVDWGFVEWYDLCFFEKKYIIFISFFYVLDDVYEGLWDGVVMFLRFCGMGVGG